MPRDEEPQIPAESVVESGLEPMLGGNRAPKSLVKSLDAELALDPTDIPTLERLAAGYVALLECDDRNVRRRAASVLGKLGKHCAAAPKVLINAMLGGDRSFRETAAAALRRMGPAVAQLAADHLIATASSDADAETRSTAFILMPQLGKKTCPSTSAAAMRHLTDKAPEVRALACAALGNMAFSDWFTSSQKRGLATAISLCVNDSDGEVRMWALGTLGRLGADCAPAVADVVVRLRDPDNETRRRCAYVIQMAGPSAAPAVAVLIPLLADSDTVLLGHVVRALGAIGPAAHEAVAPLLRLLGPDGPKTLGHLQRSFIIEPVVRALRSIGQEHVAAFTKDRNLGECARIALQEMKALQ